MTLSSTSIDVLDFDALSQWGPWIAEIIADIGGQNLVDQLAQTSPELGRRLISAQSDADAGEFDHGEEG